MRLAQNLLATHQWLVVLACILFAIPLAAYTVNGSFMRLNNDDYCYAAILRQHGFWGAQQHSYLHVATYNGNRYSLTLFSGVSGLFGPRANGALPGLALVLWLLGISWALGNLAKIWQIPIPFTVLLLLAEAAVFFTLHEAPELTQILYWRSGMLPYLAPLVANTFLWGLILLQAQQEKPLYLVWIGIALLALLAGGFSETGAALQAGTLILALVGIAASRRWLPARVTRVTIPVVIALMGTILALFLLIVSPTVRERQAIFPPPPDVINLLRISLQSAYIFIHSSVKHLLLPTLISASLSAILSFLIYHQTPQQAPPIRRVVASFFMTAIACWLLVVCCVAPSAYAQSSYPELRALITARFVMVLTALFLGWLAGQVLGGMLQRLHADKFALAWLGFALLGLLCIYPLGATFAITADTAKFRKWATLWDARDQEIRAAQAQGLREVKVMELDHVIQGGSELKEDTFWINNCAEMYYGLDSLNATEPGWDEK